MVLKPGQIVSAQVLLRAASGKRPDGRSRITAENLAEWMPSSETAQRVREAFRSLGFEVGELLGNSFAINGPVRLFESVFKTGLRQSKAGGMQFADSEPGSGHELAPAKIPRDLREDVVAITFTPPPDFGPTNFSA